MHSPRVATALLGALLGAGALTGCTAATEPEVDAGRAAEQVAPDAAGATPTPAPTSSCTPAPLEERAAAVLVVGIPGVTSADEELGRSVVDLGVSGLFVSESNYVSHEQVRDLVTGLREHAGRPLLVSADEESGRVALTPEGAGPSPRRLARERTPAEVREYAAGIGARLADLGIDLNLAPSLDLDDGDYSGIIGDRSFSADPQTAAAYGLAFSAGVLDAGVTPTVKHFPGHGRSTTDTHSAVESITATVEELRGTDLAPFQTAIDAGAPVVMLNHLEYTALEAGLPASLSPGAYELLRAMDFEGVAMTDSLGMGAVHGRWDFPEAAVMAVEAGADAVLATDGRQALGMRDALVAAVASGRIPQERLDEAAARVTALAGGDPVAMACLEVEIPRLSLPEPAPTATSSP